MTVIEIPRRPLQFEVYQKPIDRSRGRTPQERLASLSRPNPATGCIEWIGATMRQGGYTYGAFYFRRRPFPAHRAAWILAYGELPSSISVKPACGNPLCVNVAHLHAVPQAAQAARARAAAAAKRPPKLTDEIVRAIRASTRSDRALATIYGVHHTAIQKARLGITWKHVK